MPAEAAAGTLAPAARAARPDAGWLAGYTVGTSGGDLYGDAADGIARTWERAVAGLAGPVDGSPSALQESVARYTAELGLTFRVTGDDDERVWPLNAMPLVIGAAEWAEVERGLVQRAELMERLATDLYGDQRVVAEGHLPAAVVAGSPFFARQMLGRPPRKGAAINVYAADLARGPRGQWRVLSDRLRFASGIGYALENRLALSRATGSVMSDCHVRRLASFFSQMREGIAAQCRRERPRIALLTPGRYNQSYAEQAHLARYLGLPLVEGRDLSAVGDRLYLGTIAGPRRVDAIWRWTNTSALDPLAFDARSELGVAGLFDTWAAGGLEIANRPGVEVLESPAFAAFMPRLAQVLLGEAPILPNVATWWCGQADEAATVVRRLDTLAVAPAFGREVEGLAGIAPVEGASLDPAARAALLEALRRRPMDYCGQEIVQLSTTPTIVEGRLAPRPFTLRVFVARTADGGWSVMPGGFARLSTSRGLPTSLMGEGEMSADVWVVDEAPTPLQAPGLLALEPPITRGGGILASQAADNLFWFGRYNERAEAIVRVIRSILGASIEADARLSGSSAVLAALVDLLVQWGVITPGTGAAEPSQVCGRALVETKLPGGVAALMRRRQQVGMALRDRFARDFWRIVSRPMPSIDPQVSQSMLESAKWLTEHFSALAGLAQENMVRGPAWRFLEIGARIERATATCRIASVLMGVGERAEALGALLDLADSQIVYRSRYLTEPMDNPVHDLVLLDPENPRALVFQVAEIAAHLAALPSAREDNLPEEPLRMARSLLGDLQSATATDLDAARLADFEARLFALSDAISARYFLQIERETTEMRPTLLG